MLNKPKKYLDTSALKQPILIIIIDTEEEFNWNKPFARENNSVKKYSSSRKSAKKYFQNTV